jgi:endonuclease/exonuclease/phosphatase family metal-dependent hydrolase
MKNDSLTIITLNCQRGYLLSELDYYLNSIVIEQKADLILLQEVSPKVAHIIREIIKKRYAYQLLLLDNEQRGRKTEVGVLYKAEFKLLESKYISYQDFVKKQTNDTGAVIAKFVIPDHYNMSQKELVVCSSHLHASYHYLARRKELLFIKQTILEYASKTSICIIGGDFNYLFPGELKSGNIIMNPDFIHVTNYKEHSCNSSLLEPTEFQNKLFKFLARIGLKFLLKVDHIYVDKDSLNNVEYISRVIDVTVSDHRPIETILSRKVLATSL